MKHRMRLSTVAGSERRKPSKALKLSASAPKKSRSGVYSNVVGAAGSRMLVPWRLSDTGLICESTQGNLVGETFEGQALIGSDALRMVERGGGKP